MPESDIGALDALQARVGVSRDQLADFCRSRKIRRLSVFGSVLREDFGPESDVDFLVEFEPGRGPSLFGMAGMQLELEKLLGRNVDFITRASVERSPNHIRRKSVLDSAKVVYAA